MCVLQLFTNARCFHQGTQRNRRMLRFGTTAIGVKPVSLLLLVISMVPVHSVQVTFLVDTTNHLSCSGNIANNETYIWADNTTIPDTRLFTVDEEVEKTNEARDIDKYDNFGILSHFPVATSLTMTSISLEDRGTYTCGLVESSRTLETFVVEVEAEPLFIDISCASRDDCESTPSSPAPSSVVCTCKAVGVYPDTLTFVGNGNPAKKNDVVQTSSGPDGSFDISADFNVSPDDSTDNFQCSLVGYNVKVNTRRTTGTYKFQPPLCELLVIKDETCSTAWLHCMCNNSIPEVTLYTFYDEAKELIEEPTLYPKKEVELKGDLSTFYCRGCNGVNYAPKRLIGHYADCRRGPRIGLILGLVFGLGGSILIIAVGICGCSLHSICRKKHKDLDDRTDSSSLGLSNTFCHQYHPPPSYSHGNFCLEFR